MRRFLPSFSALQCFEAAARHQSFTRAAEELNLTQSAVSRQVRNLEDYLQLDLFERVKKRLILSEAGEKYAREVGDLLDRMEAATIRLMTQHDSQGVLEVGTLPTFGSRWLIPRLEGFASSYPDIQLNLVTHTRDIDFATQNIDIAIQYGQGNWPGCVSHLICEETVVAVGAPKLLGNDPERPAADVLGFTMLQLATRKQAWSQWLSAKNLGDREPGHGPCFEQFSMVSQAALSGLGLAVMPTLFVEDDLRSGRLIAPFGEAVPSGKGYYVVYPEDKSGLAKVQAFRDWIIQA